MTKYGYTQGPTTRAPCSQTPIPQKSRPEVGFRQPRELHSCIHTPAAAAASSHAAPRSSHRPSPGRSHPRPRLLTHFLTRSAAHSGSCTLTKPLRVSLSHTHTHARALLTPSSTHSSALPASSAAASLPRPPAPRPRSFRPAPSTRSSRTRGGPGRTGTGPSPPRRGQLAPRGPPPPGCSAPPGSRSSPAHTTSLAPDRDGARRLGTRLGVGASVGASSGRRGHGRSACCHGQLREASRGTD